MKIRCVSTDDKPDFFSVWPYILQTFPEVDVSD